MQTIIQSYKINGCNEKNDIPNNHDTQGSDHYNPV